jgi:hypothetical protein
MCYIDGQKNKYSVLNECSRMLKYNIFKRGVKLPLRLLWLFHSLQFRELCGRTTNTLTQFVVVLTVLLSSLRADVDASDSKLFPSTGLKCS